MQKLCRKYLFFELIKIFLILNLFFKDAIKILLFKKLILIKNVEKFFNQFILIYSMI